MHGTALNNYPKPPSSPVPAGSNSKTVMIYEYTATAASKLLIYRSCHPTLFSYAATLRCSDDRWGHLLLSAIPGKLALAPLCLPATPFAGGGEVELCTGWGVLCLYLWAAAKVKLCPAPSALPNFPLVVAEGGVAQPGGRPRCLVCLFILHLARMSGILYVRLCSTWSDGVRAGMMNVVYVVYRSQQRQHMLSE